MTDSLVRLDRVGQDVTPLQLAHAAAMRSGRGPVHLACNTQQEPTKGGIVPGTNPHRIPPHIVHVSSPEGVLDVPSAMMTKEHVAQALQGYDKVYLDSLAEDEHAALVMRELAKLAADQRVTAAKPVSAPIVPVTAGPAALEPPLMSPTPMEVPTAKPAAPLRLARPQIMRNGTERAVVQAEQAPPQPLVRATFEITHFGEHSVYYHDVIQSGGFVVLVHDARSKSPRYFPPSPKAGADVPAFGLVVEREGQPPQQWLAYTTGVTFSYDSRDFCVLMTDPVPEV